MSSAWYFPAWNGDVRIEEDPENERSTIITIIEPTVEELRVLGACAELFKSKGWLNNRKTIWNPRGNRSRQTARVTAPLVDIGLYMIAHLKPGVTSLTAVKLEDGTVTAKGSAERGFLAWLNSMFSSADGNKKVGQTHQLANMLESAAGIDSVAAREIATEMWTRSEDVRKKKKKAAAEKEEPKEDPPYRKEADLVTEKKPEKKAATVKRPTSCCPRCLPGSVEAASEVLLEFLDEEQHEMWAEERAIIVHGHMSGHRYLLSHRHGRHAQRAGKICFDIDDGAVLHFHHNSVPPEEEVLAAKLCLEHRENWLRHEASCLGGPFDWVFKNPFGDGGDGVPDSQFTGAIGTFIRSFLMTFEGGRFAMPEDKPFLGEVNASVNEILGPLANSGYFCQGPYVY